MSPRKATGSWSKSFITSSADSNMLQARTLEYIEREWNTEAETITIGETPVTLENFLDNLKSVQSDPVKYRQLEMSLTDQLLPIIQQALSQGQRQQ